MTLLESRLVPVTPGWLRVGLAIGSAFLGDLVFWSPLWGPGYAWQEVSFTSPSLAPLCLTAGGTALALVAATRIDERLALRLTARREEAARRG